MITYWKMHILQTQEDHSYILPFPKVEGLRMERGQLEGRIEQLCDVLAERDNTVQRLEEDLLRIRMVSG